MKAGGGIFIINRDEDFYGLERRYVYSKSAVIG